MTTTNGNGAQRLGAVLNKEQFEARMLGHIDSLQGLVENALASRSEFFRRQMLDPRRNLDDDCGYPDPNTLDPWYYRDLYDREPVAERVVALMPKECWQISPEVYEDEDPDETTPFEDAWDNLSKQLRGDGSYFQDEEGSPVWEYLYRADKLSGIGNFGVLLLGFDDGRPLYEPVEGVVSSEPVANAHAISMPYVSQEDVTYAKRTEGDRKSKLTVNLASPVSSSGKVYKDGRLEPLSTLGTDAQYFEPMAGPAEFPSVKPSSKKRRLLFLRAFDHSLVQVSQYEGNILNPRFGQPVMYRVTLNDPREYMNTGAGLSLATVQVHWSRVLHVADNLNASEVMGAPRMRPVLNPILDVKKVRGGSAEMYWKGAFPGIALSTHPQLGGDVPVDSDSMKGMMENYANTLQRYLLLVGMSANTLSPTVVDPTTQVNVQIEAICVQLGCPVRVFRGSERGELASTQDDSAWNDRLRHRQNNYITPRMIVPFVDRLILVGVLPVPKKRRTDSPDLSTAQEAPKPAFSTSSQETGRPRVPPAFSRNAETGKLDRSVKESGTRDESKGGYSVRWSDLDSLGEKDRAGIAAQYTTALAAYISGGVEALVPPKSFLTHFVNFDEEEAQAILDEAERHQEEEMEEHADLADMGEEHDLVPTPPTGFENKPEPPPPMPGMPGGPPQSPVKMKDGEALVQPDTGKTVAAIPAKKPPTKNMKYTFDAEDCPKCGASMEGDPYSGECNSCGHKWGKEVTKNTSTAVPAITVSKEGIQTSNWPTIFTDDEVTNAFCPTGPGGGVDPSCSPGGTSKFSFGGKNELSDAKRQMDWARQYGTIEQKTEAKQRLAKARGKSEVMEDKEFHHGTSSISLKAIMKEGLQVPKGTDETHIYLTRSSDSAESWAEGKSEYMQELGHKSTPVVLKIRIPGSHASKIEKDPFMEDDESFRLPSDIPPSWIVGGRVHRGGRWHDIGKGVTNTSESIFYIPITVVDDVFDEIIENAFCPTGPGGGVDPSCSPGHHETIRDAMSRGSVDEVRAAVEKLSSESKEEVAKVAERLGFYIAPGKSKKAMIELIKGNSEGIAGSVARSRIIATQNSNPEGCNQYKDCGSSQEEGGEHLKTLKAISDEFTKGSGGREEVMARVDQVLAGLSKEQLKEAAQKFGARSAKGRKERIDGIKRFISDRREMYQRTLHNSNPEGCNQYKSCGETLKEHERRSYDVDTYPKEEAAKMVESLKSLGKDEVLQAAREAGIKVHSKSKRGMLEDIYKNLVAGHTARERIQA